uniref:NADH dehydrogenase subunit 5 n=1 Tax=Stroggylocephalus agrestis TaxID=3112133 RepID=UPI002E79B616|nr:NADH dehydrogenase subunit 5 [Stroggylocephalus agrestis]WRK21278.1 NADH dehydrogenase subunit 5 [Stroggylocephalus agrestis]
MIKFNFYFMWFFVMIFLCFIFLYFGFIFLIYDFCMLIEIKLLLINSFMVCYVLFFDFISLMFIFVVMLISSFVVLFSSQYMGYKSYSCIRFLFLVLLFVLSMILMILSPNLMSILLGWDGLGLVSYCLVIFYNSNKSYISGMITCLTNRLGDIGLLVSLCWMFSYGSWHFLFYYNFVNDYIYMMICISSFTKSAQIPFSCWLPAAMSAPTPVSALVHSSTLVTSGVYLLIRFFHYFHQSFIFLLLSSVTMLMSSFCAIYEFDLKKIIAFSTLSQLGLMMTSLFLGFTDMSFFHLLSHAMFKSLLFLCSGIFIFYMNDNQDIRMMGCVCMNMPFVTSCFNISNITLCGIPFLSGFYSKDLIIEMSIFSNLNFIIFMIIYFSVGLTVFYTIRLFFYSMIMNFNFYPMFFCNNKIDFMSISVFFLSFICVIFGSLVMWTMNFDMTFMVLPFSLKMMILFLIFLGGFFGYEFMMYGYFFFINYYMFNGYMWFLQSFTYYSYIYFYGICLDTNKLNYWGEFYGVSGSSFYFLKLSNYLQLFFNNNFKILLLSVLLWFFIII